MNPHTANQSWIAERGGDIVENKAQSSRKFGPLGASGLLPLDYRLYDEKRGRLENAEVMYPDFQKDAARFSKSLGLVTRHQTFSPSRRKLQQEYINHFEAICEEIKQAEPHGPET